MHLLFPHILTLFFTFYMASPSESLATPLKANQRATTIVPLKVTSVTPLGITTDNSSRTSGVFHDGGGGATQNGYHVQVFADSQTESYGKPGWSFVHNSIAYSGVNDANPTNLTTFGMTGTPGSKTFTGPLLGPMTANETALNEKFSIWMLNGLTPLPDGKTILGVFPALIQSTSGPTQDLYSTMASITVVPPSQISPGSFPPAKRLGTGRLFYPGEIQYGNFALVTASQYLYLFGADTTGVKIARTPLGWSTLADRTKYTYYQPKTGTWTTTPAVKNDAAQNILNHTVEFFGNVRGPDTGDVFYSAYHKTFVMVWMDGLIDGIFWASQSTSGTVTGPWSAPQQIWTSPLAKECAGQGWNYQGHAHPGWDSTGKTLMISYVSCVNYVSMAKVVWG